MISYIDQLRSYKIAKMALFDWVSSILIGCVVGILVFKIKTCIDWFFFFILWILFGVCMHLIFKVPTMLGYYLQLNKKPVRVDL